MDGVLIIDKPQGITSHDVVAVARRALEEKRIGHTGTLDPLATGVLPLACGRATRLTRFLSASDKDYEATIRFGLATDSYDVTGNVLERFETLPDREAVEQAVSSLRGEYLQMPPPYSAKKVAGRRAYVAARRDEPVALKPVTVNVSRADVVAFADGSATVNLTCSAGFYVRAFAHQLGQLVGTGACLESLRRTRAGEFRLNQALTFAQLTDARSADDIAATVFPLERLLPGLPAVYVTQMGVSHVQHGRELQRGDYYAAERQPESIPTSEWVRVLDVRAGLLALARAGRTPDSLHPSIVLI